MSFLSSRRAGDFILFSGIVGRDPDGTVISGRRPQIERILDRISAELEANEAAWGDVVRVRVFMTDADDWPVIRDLLDQQLSDNAPAALAAVVSGFIEPDIAAEIEIDAFIASTEAEV